MTLGASQTTGGAEQRPVERSQVRKPGQRSSKSQGTGGPASAFDADDPAQRQSVRRQTASGSRRVTASAPCSTRGAPACGFFFLASEKRRRSTLTRVFSLTLGLRAQGVAPICNGERLACACGAPLTLGGSGGGGGANRVDAGPSFDSGVLQDAGSSATDAGSQGNGDAGPQQPDAGPPMVAVASGTSETLSQVWVSSASDAVRRPISRRRSSAWSASRQVMCGLQAQPIQPFIETGRR